MALTDRQRDIIVELLENSEIDSVGVQKLLDSGRFHALLEEFTVHPELTVTPIKVTMDYSRTFVQMRDAGKYDYVNPEFNDTNFPVEAGENGDSELVLVCFHRDVDDDEDKKESELLRELDKLGLKPEGPPELCAVGERHPELQREFPIVARRQVWRDPDGDLFCPVLDASSVGCGIDLYDVHGSWNASDRFLCSRKPKSNK